jgi:hypothetical protein
MLAEPFYKIKLNFFLTVNIYQNEISTRNTRPTRVVLNQIVKPYQQKGKQLTYGMLKYYTKLNENY